MLAILRHDGTCSIVFVNGRAPDAAQPQNGCLVWVTFGEVTPDGFSPCYASILVSATDLRTIVDTPVIIP